MKKRIVSLLMAILAVMVLMPGLVYAQSNTIAVTPSSNVGVVGTTFTVTVTIEDVSALVGYDVTLQYDTIVLDITSAFTVTEPFAAHGFSRFVVVQSASDANGQVRLAVSALGGNTLSIPAGAPEPLFDVTFMVVGLADSPLDLVNVELACLSGGVVVSCPATLMPGGFFVPPSIVFDTSVPLSHYIAQGEMVRHLSKGQNFVDLNGFILLPANASRPGFGGVRFIVQDPQGNTYSADSNIAFLFPGGTAGVQGTVTYGNVLGTYKLFVTVLRCTSSDVASCIAGPTMSAKNFRVHA